jgi:DNA-binding NarL/FixJ family response regulator
VVVDIALPLLNGLDAARHLKRVRPELKVIFLAAGDGCTLATEASRAGASAYLLLNSPASEQVKAIHEVFEGRSYVTALAAMKFVEAFRCGPEPFDLTLPVI